MSQNNEPHRGNRAWHQVLVRFPDYDTAQDTAVIHLAPILKIAEDRGLVASWFFTRKKPCWRLRFGLDADDNSGFEFVHTRLDALVEGGHVSSLTKTIYEPEVHAFGGSDGMAVAHKLFHADSRQVLTHFRTENAVIGRRELSVLLCSALLRGAGQDWYEQGDVWARVAQHQAPLVADAPPTGRQHRLQEQLRRLMITDTSPDGPLFAATGSLAGLVGWFAAFADAGQALRVLATEGRLERGLRAVLTHQVLFHWNRLGLDPHTKTLLANSAAGAIFADGSPPAAPSRQDIDDQATKQE
ncbi:thiopeptide-type bacteriocin biosynthesis protein [Lentzea sp. NPDC004782]|uniref:thiopeptide-type bacteriocin biosynthesis protein n=1 Tax=Lentzea sp. NPDC004782 TaxID=3154458 RepID=UPI0033A64417